MKLLVGSYTGDKGHGRGITTLKVDVSTWVAETVDVCVLDSPSWLVRHPARPVVYAANETAEGRIAVLELGDDGRLTRAAEHPTGGADPCHLALDPGAGTLFAANYTGGSLAAFRLTADGTVRDRSALYTHRMGGGPGPVADRQEAAHVHMAVSRPGGTVAAVDLGQDRVVVYAVTDGGGLDPVASTPLPAGTGPRQLVDLPDGRVVLAGELAATLVMARWDGDRLRGIAASPSTAVPPATPTFPAQLVIGDHGLAYLTNRGADCVTVFRIKPDTLTPVVDVSTVAWPRHACLVDGHLLVAGERADAVDVLRLDGDGIPQPTGRRLEVPSPAFVLPL